MARHAGAADAPATAGHSPAAGVDIAGTLAGASPPVRVDVTVAPLAVDLDSALLLRPVLLPGGLGAHKWADRAALDALVPDGTPLLFDADGAVLEAAFANVWARFGDRLLTPPADGRLLPGTARARLLARAPRAAEARLTLADLRAADGLLVTSALRGAQAATLDPAAPVDPAPPARLRALVLAETTQGRAHASERFQANGCD